MYYILRDLYHLDCRLTDRRLDLSREHGTKVGDKSVPLDREYDLAQCCIRRLAEFSELMWVTNQRSGRRRYNIVQVKAVKEEFETIKHSCPKAYGFVSVYLRHLEHWTIDKEAEKLYPFINKELPDGRVLVSTYFEGLLSNPYLIEDVLDSEYGWIDKAVIEGILWKIKVSYQVLQVSKLNAPTRWCKKPLSPEITRIFKERINIYWDLYKDNAKRVKKGGVIRDFRIDAENIKPYDPGKGPRAELKRKLQRAFDIAARSKDYEKSDYMLSLNLDILARALKHLDKLLEECNDTAALKVLTKLKNMDFDYEVKTILKDVIKCIEQ